jgi:DNA-binding transcriptional LysR family regulator
MAKDLGTPELTSRQLQTVIALAEYGSFIAAAAWLKTSQPAVTRTLKHVEEVLGIKLFDRSTRSVRITAAGKEFVGVATRMLNDLRITIRSMRELSDQRRGQVVLSSIMSVANGKLPGFVSAYRLDHPGIELQVREGVHGMVMEDVRSGTADFGITYLDELPDPFAGVSLGREEFTVVLPRRRAASRPANGFANEARHRRCRFCRRFELEPRGHRFTIRDDVGIRARRHRPGGCAEERSSELSREGTKCSTHTWQTSRARPRDHNAQGARSLPRGIRSYGTYRELVECCRPLGRSRPQESTDL